MTILECTTSDFDIIFLSYDEANAEENWSDLLTKVPWAKRVHGVKGFDNAHKECAKLSQTENFITVDGDNKIDRDFLDQKIVINQDWIYSWGSKNYVNGLIYGNGGLKLWPKRVALDMNTHENSNEGGIEFCWSLPYYQMNDWYSITYCNGSPLQAFRSGFREGVKLSLNNGQRVNDLNMLWHGNIKRLITWMTVGADVKNGIYSIFGARMGCYLTNLTEFSISDISDYDWFNDQWNNEWLELIEDEERMVDEYNRLCKEISENLKLPIANLGKNQSKLFKATMTNPSRMGLTVPEKNGEDHLIKDNFKDKNI